MRHFAIECAEAGFPVYYHSTEKWYEDALTEILEQQDHLSLFMMEASEWDTREQQHRIKNEFERRIEVIPNNFFLANANEYKDKIAPAIEWSISIEICDE